MVGWVWLALSVVEFTRFLLALSAASYLDAFAGVLFFWIGVIVWLPVAVGSAGLIKRRPWGWWLLVLSVPAATIIWAFPLFGQEAWHIRASAVLATVTELILLAGGSRGWEDYG